MVVTTVMPTNSLVRRNQSRRTRRNQFSLLPRGYRQKDVYLLPLEHVLLMTRRPSYSGKRRIRGEKLFRAATSTCMSEQVLITRYYRTLLTIVGDAGKQSAALPAKRALHNLVNNAVSPEEWQRTISILKQWRRYPTRPIPTGVQELFISGLFC